MKLGAHNFRTGSCPSVEASSRNTLPFRLILFQFYSVAEFLFGLGGCGRAGGGRGGTGRGGAREKGQHKASRSSDLEEKGETREGEDVSVCPLSLPRSVSLSLSPRAATRKAGKFTTQGKSWVGVRCGRASRGGDPVRGPVPCGTRGRETSPRLPLPT